MEGRLKGRETGCKKPTRLLHHSKQETQEEGSDEEKQSHQQRNAKSVWKATKEKNQKDLVTVLKGRVTEGQGEVSGLGQLKLGASQTILGSGKVSNLKVLHSFSSFCEEVMLKT